MIIRNQFRLYSVWLCIGLAGKTDEEKFQADMIVHCVEDVVKLIIDILHEEDPGPKVSLV